MSIVGEIIDLSTSLSNTYSTSNLPKFLKDIMYNHQIKKIKKLISKIPNDVITFDSLFDFACNVYVSRYDLNLKYARYNDIDITNNSSRSNDYEIRTKFNIDDNNTIAYVDLNEKVSKLRETVQSDYIYSLKIRIVITSNAGMSSIYFTNLDKYQEISNNVLQDLKETQYNQLQAKIFAKLQYVLIDHIKSYLYENLGVFESINL